jgi:hypothetical protein
MEGSDGGEGREEKTPSRREEPQSLEWHSSRSVVSKVHQGASGGGGMSFLSVLLYVIVSLGAVLLPSSCKGRAFF